MRAGEPVKVVRALWLVAFGVSVYVLVGSLPAYWARAQGFRFPTEFSSVPQSEGWLAALMSVSSALLCLGLAVLLFLKKPNDRMALFLSFYLFLYGIVLAGPLETFLPFWFPATGDLALQLQGGIIVFGLALILVFPNGQFAPRWTRWLVVIAILEIPIALLRIGDFSELYLINSLAAQILYAALGVLLIVALGVQVYRYRRLYTPVERQQTKWVVYGFVVSYFLFALASIPYYYWLNVPPGTPEPWWLPLTNVGWQFALSIQPLALTLAILRARLWDIDVIIRRTVTYAIVVTCLAFVYFSSIVLLQQIFATVSGQRSEVITVLSTLVIAVLFVPLRNQVQQVIDRHFYRKKYDAQQVLSEFALTVRDETNLERLVKKLIEVVEETMQPQTVRVWLETSDDERQRTKEVS